MGSDDQRMTTYKLANGEPVLGEFSWVTDLDYFDDLEEPVEIIEQRWECVITQRRWLVPSTAYYSCGVIDCDEDAVGWYMIGTKPDARCEDHNLGLDPIEHIGPTPGCVIDGYEQTLFNAYTER